MERTSSSRKREATSRPAGVSRTSEVASGQENWAREEEDLSEGSPLACRKTRNSRGVAPITRHDHRQTERVRDRAGAGRGRDQRQRPLVRDGAGAGGRGAGSGGPAADRRGRWADQGRAGVEQ